MDTNKKVRAPRPIKPDGREYRRRERELRECYAITVVTCEHCGSPRHEKYVCLHCGKG